MAVTKNRDDSMFTLTSGAREAAARLKAEPAHLVTRNEPAVSEPAPKERVLAQKTVSVRLWEDQFQLIFDLRYRSHNAWTTAELVRRAVDEYLVVHADELMATPDEVAAIEAAAAGNALPCGLR